MKNRILPADVEILSNKEFDDIVYLYLQCISTEKGKIPDFKKKTAFEALDTSFTTFAKKLKWIQNNLCTDGLLQQDFYRYVAIPERTLKCLLVYSDNHRGTLKIYIYLLSKFYRNHQCPTTFSLKELNQITGYASNAANNRKVMKSLKILEELNLIAPVFKETGGTHTLLTASRIANTTSTFDKEFGQKLSIFGIEN